MTYRTYAPRAARPAAWTTRPASEKALAWATTLVAERMLADLDEADCITVAAIRAGEPVNGGACSRLIDALKGARRMPRESDASEPSTAEVPAGRYALDRGDGNLEFVQVDRPDKGRWEGYTFVKRLAGAPGDFAQFKVSRADSARLLAEILADTFRDVWTEDDETTVRELTGAQAATVRFSRHFTVCAACCAALSDKKSRMIGLGPVCRTRY